MRNRVTSTAVALVLAGVASPALAISQTDETAEATTPPKKASLQSGEEAVGAVAAPEAVTRMTDWVIASQDNGALPFMVIDKIAAKVFVYDAEGQFLGATPALLGIARGDDSVPGVGDRELSDIAPADRTTPAGRFVAGFGAARGNRSVLWVDYATAISLHPVVTTNKKERRVKRLASPSPKDNRITYGCINVSPAFYKKIRTVFTGTTGVVYILPETKAMEEVFPSFRPQTQSRQFSDASP